MGVQTCSIISTLRQMLFDISTDSSDERDVSISLQGSCSSVQTCSIMSTVRQMLFDNSIDSSNERDVCLASQAPITLQGPCSTCSPESAAFEYGKSKFGLIFYLELYGGQRIYSKDIFSVRVVYFGDLA